jgi:hypothetical protein
MRYAQGYRKSTWLESVLARGHDGGALLAFGAG